MLLHITMHGASDLFAHVKKVARVSPALKESKHTHHDSDHLGLLRKRPQSDPFAVGDRNHHLRFGREQAQVVALHGRAGELLVGDALHERYALARIHDLVADLEVHTPPYLDQFIVARNGSRSGGFDQPPAGSAST